MEAAIKTIEVLLRRLKDLQPLKPADQQRLDKKIRLEFNFNSNHIEGNTLTYGETELLLFFDKTTGNHEMREYEEMKSHDAAFEMIKEWAADKERPLSEMILKNLHEVLLVRPFWKEAITPDGQRTRRLIKIGTYKEYPNSVRLQNGEMFHYASPEETPILMGELIQWYREEDEKDELHPIVLAALLHYKFVRIHPFDDGNGRISRLLMNYVLFKHNLPPVIIKSTDKKSYLFALNQADTGNLNAFIEYIAEQLAWSLELLIKAAKGESLEETDDINKEILLFKKAFNRVNERKEKRSTESIVNILRSSSIPLFEKAIEKLALFNDLFDSYKHRIIFNQRPDLNFDIQKRSGGLMLSNEKFPDVTYLWIEKLLNQGDLIYSFGLEYFFEGYKWGYPLNVLTFFNFKFDLFTFHLEVESNFFEKAHYVKSNYESPASQETNTYIVNDVSKKLLSYLEENTKKLEF